MNNRPSFPHYDAVIVGARAAGAATAMLLARQGIRVLAVDRQSYGADTLSTHALMRGAVSRLARWGILEDVWRAGTPVISSMKFVYGGQPVAIDIRPEPGIAGLAAPRRTVLDPLLVDAARASGAEVLHDTRVGRLHVDDTGRVTGLNLTLNDGTSVDVTTDLVIGADGLRSFVARSVGAPITRQGTEASAYMVRYYRGADLGRTGLRWMYQPGAGGGIIPTNGDAFCVFTAIPPQRFREEGRKDVTAVHRDTLRYLDPEFAAAVEAATPIGPMRSFPGVPGQFRLPQGPGWALVGDAGYFKDPYAAHGIADAFRDAELLTEAVLTGDFASYEGRRDELSLPLFEILERIASYDWDFETLQGLHLGLSAVMKAEDQATAPTLTTAA